MMFFCNGVLSVVSPKRLSLMYNSKYSTSKKIENSESAFDMIL